MTVDCSNTTSLPNDAEALPTWFTAIAFGVAGISGIVFLLYSYVLYVILKNFNSLENKAYHVTLVVIGVYDLVSLIRISSIDTTYDGSASKPYYFAIMLMYYGQSFTTTVMTMNRAVAILFWKSYKQIATVKSTLLCLCFVQVLALAMAFPTLFPFGTVVIETCFAKFLVFTTMYAVVEMVVPGTVTVATLMVYLAMAVKIRKHGFKTATTTDQTKNVQKAEYKIFIQSICIVSVPSFAWVYTIISVYVLGGYFYENMVVYSITALITHGMNPFLYMAFSTNIRHSVLKHWRTTKVSTVTTTRVTPAITTTL